jgi:hypothetical protein
MILTRYADNPNDYNTYADVTDVQTVGDYLPLLDKAFVALADSDKAGYLYMATLHMDSKYQWKGVKKHDSQPLALPRHNCDISRGVIFSCVLIASQLYKKRSTELEQLINNTGDIQRERIGRTLEVEYKKFTESNIVDAFEDTILEQTIKVLLGNCIEQGVYLWRG